MGAPSIAGATRGPEVLTQAVPVRDPAAVLGAMPGQEAFLLERRGASEVVVGFGAARAIEASGPDRLARIAEASAALFGGLRMYGGFAFEDHVSGVWSAFGAARFVLPRWLYRIHDGRASLTLVRTPEDGDELDAAHRRLVAALTALRVDEVPSARLEPTTSDHAGRVAAGLAAIRRGELEKVVLSRRIAVEAEAEYRPGPVVARLDGTGAARFAFVRGSAFFAGATPELLVSRRGAEVLSEALAGSADRAGRASLLTDAKERAEHGFVAQHVEATLSRFSSDVEVGDPQPSVLPEVTHLRTPVRATLAHPAHVLTLADALHPTPAVCGVPVEPARRFIAGAEGSPRGWYAGAVGWFDAEGDGELYVALRSALFDGARAMLYAGGGIVAGSIPVKEAAETELKARTMARALGVAQ